MNVGEVVDRLSLEVDTSNADLGRSVTGCYISDLLSDVMANAREGDLWVTLQTHPNIAAVASLKNLAGIIITNSRRPEEETVRKAEGERIFIATSSASTFEVGGMLFNMLRC